MEPMSWGKKVIIILTAMIYIVHLVFNSLSATGKPGDTLFPNTVGNISRHFDIPITPVSSTFAIWSAIFIFQVLWIVYTITTIFRKGNATNILSFKFFITFNLNITCVVAWLFTWSRKQDIASFVLLIVGQILFDSTLLFAFYDLKRFLDKKDENSDPNNNVWQFGKNLDLWIHRILIHNGLLFYGTWTTIATHLNFTIVLVYNMDVSKRVASIVALACLLVVVVSWFVIENIVLRNYAQYTFSAYIVLIIGVSGVFRNGIFDKDKVVGGLVLALLILSCLFLVVRCVVIIMRYKREKKKKASERSVESEMTIRAVATIYQQ